MALGPSAWAQQTTLALGITNTPPTSAAVGSSVSYNFSVTNTGATTATNVVFMQGLPSVTIGESHVPSQGTCSSVGTAVRCNLGSLAPSATAFIDVSATVRFEGAFAGTMAVAQADNAPFNDAFFNLSSTGGDIYFPDFASVDGLNLVGDAAQSGNVLRVAPAAIGQAGGAWYSTKQSVANGFTTRFKFVITADGTPADSLSFVIQNTGPTAIGTGGYPYNNLPNSVAVELDVFENSDHGDPNGNHVSVHTAGTEDNDFRETFSLGSSTAIPLLADAAVHQMRVDYVPGRLVIYIDDLERPVLVVPIDLGATLSLDNGSAFVGFVAGTGGAFAAFDVTEWAFSGVNAVNEDGSVLYATTSREFGNGNLLRVVDPLTARVVTTIPITLAGQTVLGGQALATHPFSGELYAMLFLQGVTGRELVKINPITGVATSIGNTGRRFAAMTFDCNGTLFGVTGEGDLTDLESLFSISTSNASTTLLAALGNGDDGEAIVFHPDDGLFYHASGLSTPIFESVDPTTFLTTDIPITGTILTDDEAMALTYWKAQGTMLYFMGFSESPLLRLAPNGDHLLISLLNFHTKGLAFVGGPAPCGPPVIQDGPDVAVSVADSPDPVNAGAAVTYTVDVSNIGTETATGVDLTVSVSGQGSLTSYPGSCTGENNSVSCPLGDIAAGTGTSEQFTVTAANGGQITLNATVTTTSTDPNNTNNAAAETTTVNDSASDATTEFSTALNPNGYWSYGWSTSRGSAFNLYTLQVSNGGLEGWHGGTDKPIVVRNVTESVVNTAGTNPIQPGQLAAHPGAAGENNVLRWTAPDSGIYQINVTFTGSDTVGTTTDVAVLHGATQLFSGNVNGFGNQQTFSGLRAVNAGNTIDFTLGHGGNGYSFDTTAIDAQVALFEPPALGAPDTQGTEFWLAFMPNNSSSELSLFIAGQTSTTGLVEIPALSFSQNFSVTPGAVTTVSIPTAAVNFGSNVADDLGIHVVAEAEVTVYGLNRLSATTDAFLGLPIDILGTEYLVMGYGGGAGSVMTVVATEDNTAVTISQGASNFAPTLNRGQRFQVALADVTGALVTSDKPVAVFGGNRCTNVPAGFSACDHLVEQIPPTVTWGTQFVTMPLATRLGGDTFRILASADNTIVTVNGTTVATLNRGQFHERIINGPSEIVATSPVLVAQYSNGSGFDGVTSDPFMMLIPPFEQFLNNYTITTPASGFATNFVNIVAASFAVGAISVDGTPVPANNFVAIGTSGFSGVQVPITVGSHNLTSAFPFGAFVYGFASFDSYGYPGGASQSPIATVDSISLTDLEPGTFEAGTEACFEVLVLDSGEVPVADIRVDFAVTGTNLTSGFDTTDESGNAGFCYTGEFGGTDTVRASVGALSSQVNKDWTPGQADVVLQALPGPTVSGVNLVYQVRVRNDGPAGASAVVVSDTLTNFQLVAISSTQGGCSGTSGFASCNVGNMRVGTSADITVTVFAGGGAGWARHSFSAGGSGIDPDLTNNLKAISFGSNQAPAAVAGANRTVPGISLSGTPVTLDGGASSDPNGDALTYRWTGPFPEGGGVVGGRTPTVTLAFGTSKVSLVVSDGGLESAPSDVLVTVSDFGVAVAGGLPSIAAGQSTSYTVTVSSIHGAFDREVALGCGGLPAFTRCTVSPVKVTPNGTSATATLTITTNATLAANPASNAVHLAWLLVFPVAGVVMFAGQRRRRTCLLGALLALALLQVACGGGGTTTSSMPVNRTPAGVHTITVNASSGALTHSSAVTVTVR